VESISSLIDQYKPDILLIGASKLGKEVAPRIASGSVQAALQTASIFPGRGKTGNQAACSRGRFIATRRFLRKPQIATIPAGKFEKNLDKAWKGEIIKISFKPAEPKVQVLEVKEKAPESDSRSKKRV